MEDVKYLILSDLIFLPSLPFFPYYYTFSDYILTYDFFLEETRFVDASVIYNHFFKETKENRRFCASVALNRL